MAKQGLAREGACGASGKERGGGTEDSSQRPDASLYIHLGLSSTGLCPAHLSSSRSLVPQALSLRALATSPCVPPCALPQGAHGSLSAVCPPTKQPEGPSEAPRQKSTITTQGEGGLYPSGELMQLHACFGLEALAFHPMAAWATPALTPYALAQGRAGSSRWLNTGDLQLWNY